MDPEKLQPSEDRSFSCQKAPSRYACLCLKSDGLSDLIDLSSEGRNFFFNQAIFNLQSSAETGVYALPHMQKSSKNFQFYDVVLKWKANQCKSVLPP